MDHFRTSGRIVLTHGDLFQAPSWLAVMLGQNITPTGYDPMANIVDDATADRQLYAMKTAIQHAAQNMPDHRDYLTKLMDGGFRR
jgi:tryptophan halogenase